MNVLFIAPYRQNDAWGESSRGYIKSLLSNPNINLTTRPYYYINNVVNNIDDAIIQCENSFYDHYDIVLQKLLPHSLSLSKMSGTKNMAIINVETGGWVNSTASMILNHLDTVYVNTTIEKKWLEQSYVKTQIKVIPGPIDVELLTANKTQSIKLPPPLTNTFKFYCIADYTHRSNLDTLVKAFHLAFGETDKVSLILKITNGGNNPNDMRNHITSELEKIKKSLSINNNYKNELIITEPLDDKNTIGLHNACDCLINITSGDNYCKQVLYGLFLGKTPIVMQNTGLCDIVNETNGFCIKSEKVPVILVQKPLPAEYDLFNANEYWYSPQIYSLIETMKKAYALSKDKKAYELKQQNGLNSVVNLTYTSTGSQLCA
jgi:hypothetical protein